MLTREVAATLHAAKLDGLLTRRSDRCATPLEHPDRVAHPWLWASVRPESAWIGSLRPFEPVCSVGTGTRAFHVKQGVVHRIIWDPNGKMWPPASEHRRVRKPQILLSLSGEASGAFRSS